MAENNRGFLGRMVEELTKPFYSDRQAKIEIGRSRSLSTSTPEVISAEPDGIVSDVSYEYVLGGQIDFILTERNNLIKQWRTAAFLPEVDAAIQEIMNEAFVYEEDDTLPISLDLDSIDVDDKLKDKMFKAWDKVIKLLDFKNRGPELFRQWYTDGTLAVESVYDNNKITDGIKRIILLPPFNFFKYKHIDTGKITFFFSKLMDNDLYNQSHISLHKLYNQTEIKYRPEQITQINSGVYSQDRLFSISNLNKAMKVINQVQLIEDSIIIYRITRAPEKKVFYIDTGRLPKGKAEEYIQNMMKKHRQKVVYNIDTGQIENRKRSISLLEDYWMPRSQDGKGTEIDVLSGTGENLSEIADLDYFYDKMYAALSVPKLRRHGSENQFRGLAPSNFEIEHDEVKFFKFVVQLRKRFNGLFLDLLKKEVLATKLFKLEDWERFKDSIHVNYKNNNEYAEIKNLQTLEQRYSIAQTATDMVEMGMLSKRWVRKMILKQTDPVIDQMDKEIEEEREKEPNDDDND